MMSGIYLDTDALSHELHKIGLTDEQVTSVVSVVETNLPIKAFPKLMNVELGEKARLVCPVLPTASVPRVCQFKFEMPGIDPRKIGRVDLPAFDYSSSEPMIIDIRLNHRAFELMKVKS
jgi:hypothetical protein